jgi:hypothetical protein
LITSRPRGRKETCHFRGLWNGSGSLDLKSVIKIHDSEPTYFKLKYCGLKKKEETHKATIVLTYILESGSWKKTMDQ